MALETPHVRAQFVSQFTDMQVRRIALLLALREFDQSVARLQTMSSGPDKLALARLVRQFVRGPQLHDEPGGYGEVLKKNASENLRNEYGSTN
jgi:hypothetical protein